MASDSAQASGRLRPAELGLYLYVEQRGAKSTRRRAIPGSAGCRGRSGEPQAE